MTSRFVTVSMRIIRWVKQFLSCYSQKSTQRAGNLLPASRILWHQERIGGCAVELERQFLNLSSGIETLSGKTDELVVRSRELLKRALGHDDDGSTFQVAVGIVQGPLIFHGQCVQVFRDLTGGLEVMSGRIGKLDRFRNRLDRSIAPLKILQTMFRIESARCSPEIQALFTSISIEIQQLQSRMSTMVSKDFEAIENTQSTLKSVIRRFEEIQSQQTAVAARLGAIENSLLQLQDQVGINRGRDVRLIGVIKAVERKVAEAVRALQFQDILNQRLEHVSQGLRNMAEQMEPQVESDDVLSFLRDSSLVESAQLEQVEHLLTEAIEALHRSLSGISLDIGELNSECVLLKDVQVATVTGDGMVQTLLDAISETREISGSTYTQTNDMYRALEPIEGLIGGLTASILDVSVQIRLIALNAQIQAVKAGEGTGLETLSARTCSISEEIAEIVADISSELTPLKDSLKGALETIEHTRSRNLEFTDLLKSSGSEQELQLHEFRNQAFAELHCVEGLITDVQSRAKSLCDSLDLRTHLFDVTSQARMELRRFSDELPERQSTRTPNARVQEYTVLYTAAAERAVHERALSGAPAHETADAAVSELLEGSVEFF